MVGPSPDLPYSLLRYYVDQQISPLQHHGRWILHSQLRAAKVESYNNSWCYLQDKKLSSHLEQADSSKYDEEFMHWGLRSNSRITIR